MQETGCADPTFEDGFADDDVTAVGVARPAGAELGVSGRALLRALVTLHPPSHAHRAAARIDTVPPRDGSSATLILMSKVTLLSA